MNVSGKGHSGTATIGKKTQIIDTTVNAVVDRELVRGLTNLTWGRTTR